MTLRSDLALIRAELAVAANVVLDEWQQDAEGYDEVFGSGGACDAIADALGNVIASSIQGDVHSGGMEGDDHAFVVVTRGDEACVVDIPASVYETGGGYQWRKRPDVVVEPDDVVIEQEDWLVKHYRDEYGDDDE